MHDLDAHPDVLGRVDEVDALDLLHPVLSRVQVDHPPERLAFAEVEMGHRAAEERGLPLGS